MDEIERFVNFVNATRAVYQNIGYLTQTFGVYKEALDPKNPQSDSELRDEERFRIQLGVWLQFLYAMQRVHAFTMFPNPEDTPLEGPQDLKTWQDTIATIRKITTELQEHLRTKETAYIAKRYKEEVGKPLEQLNNGLTKLATATDMLDAQVQKRSK